MSFADLQTLARMKNLRPDALVWNEASPEHRVRAGSLSFLFAEAATQAPAVPAVQASPATPAPTAPAAAPQRGRLSRMEFVFAILTSLFLGLLLNRAWARPRGLQQTQVSGKVTYEDGTLIQARKIRLTFHPLARPANAVTKPPVGNVIVDVNTGAFAQATTHHDGDGVVEGLHKVTVHGVGAEQLPEDVVADDYRHVRSTPLLVDTRSQPLTLTIKRPTAH